MLPCIGFSRYFRAAVSILPIKKYIDKFSINSWILNNLAIWLTRPVPGALVDKLNFANAAELPGVIKS